MTATPAWRQTARVVRRLGFGATGAEIDAAHALGVEAWLTEALAPDAPERDPGTRALPPPALAAPADGSTGENGQGKDGKDKNAKATARAESNTELDQVATWWVRRMARATNPAREKVTWVWHAHFATSRRKVRSGPAMLAQNQTLRTLGLGDFTTLANAMLVDPAMLIWLDGRKNTAKAPNENLAREFMELFALGHDGGYTEKDVREGARALTGWDVTPRGAVLTAKRHDGGTKTVLGVTGNLDAKGFAGAVLARPEHPAYLATRWWRHLAAPTDPPVDTLTRLTKAYGAGRDCRALIRAVVTDPAFAAASGTVVRSPLEWYVGALRALGAPTDDKALEAGMKPLRTLGQVPLEPPSVGGWPSGSAWLSTASARLRYVLAGALVEKADLKAVSGVPAAQRIEATAHLLGLPGFTDRTTRALTPHLDTPTALVRLALVSPENLVD